MMIGSAQSALFLRLDKGADIFRSLWPFIAFLDGQPVPGS